MTLRRLLSTSLLLSLAIAAPNLRADTIYIDASNGSPASPFDTWETASANLQDALALATSGDEIHVATGTYYPDEGGGQIDDDQSSTFQLKFGVHILGGFPSGGGDLSDRNPTENETILSGNINQDGTKDNNAHNVLTSTSIDVTAILQGFTIQDGYADGAFPANIGGGIYIDSSSPTIIDCLFLNNTGIAGGGAIYNRNGSSPTISNCSFQENSAIVGPGGAINNFASSPVITNSIFQGNSAGDGGAIFNDGPTTPIITNCVFQGNRASFDGGAISNYNSTTPILTNCSFQGNSADQFGGAIYCNAFGTPTFVNCIVWNNDANGVTNNVSASIRNNSGLPLFYSHCLVENISKGTLDATGFSPDTNLTPADPLFVLEADPSTLSPTTVGDLRLRLGSPVIAQGDNDSNTTDTDLAGSDRILDTTIDLGAYEGELIQVVSWSPAPPVALDASSLTVNVTLNEIVGSFPEEWLNALEVELIGSANYADASISGTGPGYVVSLTGLTGEGYYSLSFRSPTADAQGHVLVGESSTDPIQRQSSASTKHYVNTANSNSAAPYDTWATAATNLQDALTYSTSGDQVWVAKGTYYPDQGDDQTDDDRSASFQLQNGIAIYGGFLGGETLLSAADPASNETILSGNIDKDGTTDANSYHVLTATSVDATAILSGFTIRDGNANSAGSNGRGGAISNNSASPTLTNCSFQENQAQFGGAIYNNSTSSPTLTNCSFQENTAGVEGGAIFNNSSSPILANCTFLENTAISGGAIHNRDSSPTLTNCTFQENTATTAGAINNAFSSNPVLTNCSFRGNAAIGDGGAIHNRDSSPTLINCSFQGNMAVDGGAIHNNTSSPTLTNNSFQGNSADDDGGAIYNTNSSPTITNNILWNNQANSVTNTASASIHNIGSSIPIFSHSLVENFTKTDLDTSGASPDTNLDPTDPLFDLEVDPTTAPTTDGDLRLQGSSTVRDIGNNAANVTTTDLAGSNRILNTTIDLGAYEGGVTEILTLELAAPVVVDATSLSVTLTLKHAVSSFPATWLDALEITSNGTADTTADASVTGSGTTYTLTLNGLTGEGSFILNFNAAPANAEGIILDSSSDSQPILRTSSGTPVHYVNTANTNSAAPYDTWVSAAADLQDALAYAAPGDQVWVAQGTYYPDQGDAQTNDDRGATFQLQNGVAIYGGFLGGETQLSAANPSANETILSGDIDQVDTIFSNSRHVLTATSVDATAILNGFTIQDSYATGGFPNSHGGAILIDGASPTILNCSFQDNNAAGGGAIYTQNGASPTFENCSFQGNTASTSGGAITSNNSSPIFTNCSFQGNSTTFRGGAILIEGSSSLTLTNCSFQGNSAGISGGAIANLSTLATIVNCSFQGNKAVDSGGAIYNLFFGTLTTLENCIVWDNEAGGVSNSASASIFNDSSAVTTFSHSLVENHTANDLNTSGDSPDTNFEATDPLFVLEANPSTAPTTVGNLQLRAGSPAIDSGDSTANATSTDLAKNTRIQNSTIDLGAYEGGVTEILTFEQAEDIGNSLQINITISEGTLPTGWKDAIAIDTTGTLAYVDSTESGNGPDDYTFTITGITGDGFFSVDFDPTLAISKGILLNETSSIQDIQRISANTFNHYVNAANANPAIPYDTWETAATNLQDALLFANPTDQIWVAAGTYYPDQGKFQTPGDRSATFQLKAGVQVYGGFLGNETQSNNANPTENETILSGDIGVLDDSDDNSYHVLTAENLDEFAILKALNIFQGFTVQDGKADGSGQDIFGAGLYSSSSSPKLLNNVFKNNSAAFGGGIYLDNDSSPTITNSSFMGNSAVFGGAIRITGSSSPTLEDCSFTGNTASGAGGAIQNFTDSSLTLTDCSFQENEAGAGGAIHNLGSSFTFTNCSFMGNGATDDGGAISNINTLPSTLTNCLFSGNSASDNGGAIYSLTSSPTFTNCTLVGNKAGTDGSAIYNENASQPTLENCIVWNNGIIGTRRASMFVGEESNFTFLFCLIENHDKASLDASGSNSANNFEPIDPLFILETDPADAPTTAGNLRFQVDSPALDAGDNTANETLIDLSSDTRIQNTTIDLGAYEFIPYTELPVIVLVDDAEMELLLNETFTEPGATATDEAGDPITVTIAGHTVDTSNPGSYTITYNATDIFGNAAAQVTRTVTILDTTTPPVITLHGNSTLTVPFGSTWTDPGATATDVIGNPVTVTITGDTVDTTQTQGVFTITYNATDENDNVAIQVTRTVIIVGVIDFDPNSSNQLDQLSWTDDWILQTSTDFKTWTDVPNAQSPLTIDTSSDTQRFWRLRKAVSDI